MGIVDDLADLFTDTATWEPLTGRDDFGAPTYGAGTLFSARLVRKHKLVRDAQGDEVVATATLWIKGAPAVDPDDRIILSDGSTPHILAVDRYQEFGGHTKVFFR